MTMHPLNLIFSFLFLASSQEYRQGGGVVESLVLPAKNYHFSSNASRRRSTYLKLSSDGSELSTIRVPLERVFNGEREYLFTTRRNIRNFEWGITEVEELFESILSLGESGGPLELNAVTIMPAQIDHPLNIGKTSQLFDVHDGQQRLVTLCLIYAALRDNFLHWGKGYEEDAKEIAKATYPTKPRVDAITRVQLREREKSVLHAIQSNELEDGGMFHLEYQKRFSTKERKHLPKPELYILDAYIYLRDRISDLSPNRALNFLDDLNSETFFLVCVPSSTRMARQIVMGLGKGKNLEPVDEFKGLVCFNSIKDEHCQDEVLEKWNNLCEDVGRETLSSACLLTAQIGVKKILLKNGEVDLFEDYLKIYLNQEKNIDGAVFFETKLEPITTTLQDFYDGVTALSRSGDMPLPSLSFLRAATQIRTSKDIEMVVLHLLNHLETSCNTASERGEIEDELFQLEGIALWMMLTKPKPAVRRRRCFDIINMRNPELKDKLNRYYNPLILTAEEKHAIQERLATGEFGKGVESKVGKAILERLNEHELITSSQVQKIQYMQSTLQIEHVLPQKYIKVRDWSSQWEEDDAELWMHRLGNLALLNQKMNGKISNGPFLEKRKHYKTSPYPLTRMISDINKKKWTIKQVEENHNTTVNLAMEVWKLKII